jgi:hypothetical protein
LKIQLKVRQGGGVNNKKLKNVSKMRSKGKNAEGEKYSHRNKRKYSSIFCEGREVFLGVGADVTDLG